jgi:hypothetical protein
MTWSLDSAKALGEFATEGFEVAVPGAELWENAR